MAETIKKCHSFKVFFLLVLPLILLLPKLSSSDDIVKSERLDWHQWRGPNRDGISFEKNIVKHWSKNGQEILWRNSVGNGSSGISVFNDRLLTMWDEGEAQFLFCLESHSGKELWRYKVGDNFRNGWGNGPRSTPIVDKTMVYAVSTQGVLHAVNLSNGKASWSLDLSSEYGSRIPIYGYSSSPLIDGDNLFVEVGGRDNYAFIAPDKIFISGGFGTITGATTVQLKWHEKQYAATNLWFSDEMKNLVNSSIFYNNHIYGFDDKVLKCVDALTGEEKWETSGYGRGSLISADGKLYLRDHEEMVCFDITGNKLNSAER